MREICGVSLRNIGLPGGLLADARAEVLSGGERQSLAIARALHFGRKALVLDEPVAALAVRETDRVFTSIRTAASAGLHVLYIDHNMANVHAIADRIVFLKAGEVNVPGGPRGVGSRRTYTSNHPGEGLGGKINQFAAEFCDLDLAQ